MWPLTTQASFTFLVQSTTLLEELDNLPASLLGLFSASATITDAPLRLIMSVMLVAQVLTTVRTVLLHPTTQLVYLTVTGTSGMMKTRRYARPVMRVVVLVYVVSHVTLVSTPNARPAHAGMNVPTVLTTRIRKVRTVSVMMGTSSTMTPRPVNYAMPTVTPASTVSSTPAIPVKTGTSFND